MNPLLKTVILSTKYTGLNNRLSTRYNGYRTFITGKIIIVRIPKNI